MTVVRPLLRVSLLITLTLLGRTARADMLSEYDSPCVDHKEGEACDLDPLPSGFPGYRGECVGVGGDRRGIRLFCKLPSLQLTPTQRSCFLYYGEGSQCMRPSGANGVCRYVETRSAPAPGGVGTVAVPIYECHYVPPDHTAENITTAVVAVVGLGGLGVVVFVIRRRRARQAKAFDQSGAP